MFNICRRDKLVITDAIKSRALKCTGSASNVSCGGSKVTKSGSKVAIAKGGQRLSGVGQRSQEVDQRSHSSDIELLCKSQISSYVVDLLEKNDITCFSETWLNKNNEISVSGYQVVSKSCFKAKTSR